MPVPKPLTIPFARDALSQFINEIPDTPQAGADPQLASWSEGFGPITMQPLHSGGKPPEGPDFNGILFALSKHIVYQNGGGIYKFSQEYVDKTGGYDKGSVLIGDDGSALWVSLSDNNTENFNTATPPTQWIKISSAGVEQQIQDILGMIATKADKTTQVIAGTGLSGGGNLQANRTLSVNYGTTAGTAAQGDDARITGAAQKSANLSDLSSAPAARKNLGLGTATTRDVTVGNADVTDGRLLKVGDLGSNRHPTEGFDFNDLPELYPYSGLIPVMSNAGSINKPPKRDYYHVFQTLHSSSNNNVTQIAIPYRVDDDGFFLRNRFDGAWSSWREVLHTGNILTSTGQSTQFPMSQKAVTDAINNSAIGVGQTWQDVTASRTNGANYTNTTGRAICVLITAGASEPAAAGGTFFVGGLAIQQWNSSSSTYRLPVFAVIPPGEVYRLGLSGATQIYQWSELR